jgi:hypothetical protein
MAELSIPPWVPTVVADLARGDYSKALENEIDAGVIQRLVSDPRMKEVWSELQRKRTDGSGYFRAAVDLAGSDSEPSQPLYYPAQFSSRSEWLQSIAISKVFERSVRLGRFAMPEAVAAEMTARVDDLRDTAKKLREDASLIEETFVRKNASDFYTSASRTIREAADAYEKVADNGFAFDPHHQAAVIFSALLARTFEELFGDSLRGTVAKIASVVLENEVTGDQVREWAERGYWGTKPRTR